MSSPVGKDIELDAVGRQFEPYLTAGRDTFACGWRPCGVTCQVTGHTTVGSES